MADIFELSSQALDQVHALDPVLATHEGNYSNSSEWTDYSPAGTAAMKHFWSSTREAALAASGEGRDAEVARRVLVDECDVRLADIDRRWSLRDLNNIVSPWQYIRDVFHHSPMETESDWQAICTRLETIQDALDGYLESLQQGIESGEVPARRQVLIAIDQGRQAAGESSSFGALTTMFDEASQTGHGPDLAARLSAAVDTAKAAYSKATDWLEHTLLPVATERDAVGRDAYVAAARIWLGAEIDPIATYEWGWSELSRLGEELEHACARVQPDLSVDQVLEVLVSDPTRAAADADEFLAMMQERQEQALAELDGTHFAVDPRIRTIEVKAAPPGGAAAPHYTAPSEDFRRPGRVWYPMEGRETFPLYEEVTTAYHEGFPGHHLQNGTAMALGERLSRFHRIAIWHPGSGEGWALYAERLMGELGYLDKPDYEVGLIMSQTLRACRIVIDIGCHLELTIPDSSPVAAGQLWSYEAGVEMLTKVAHMTRHMAESEMVRYLGWPGQAISYRVGEQTILDLRDEWVAKNGADDLPRFHTELLSIGSVGLDLTRDLVREVM